MNAILSLCAAAWLLGAADDAASLSAEDRARAAKYLQSTRQGVIDATKGLSAAQWNFQPAPDRWSVAQVVEHLAASEDMFYANITEKVMKAPARTEPEDLKALDAMVLQMIPDRSHKAQAPEPLKPTNRFSSPEGALKHFMESRDRTIQFLKKTDDLRAHATDSPLKKKLDAFEWLLFDGAHSERHTKQINEVKADPNFPKSTKS